MAAHQVASRSWLSGWLVLLGATASDGVFFVLTYYGVTRFVSPSGRDLLFLAGAGLLFFLAASIVRRARRPVPGDAAGGGSRWGSLEGAPFLMGLLMGLTNPFQLAWWVAIGAGMVADYGPSIAVGFFVGIVSWTLILSALVSAGAARYEQLAPVIAYFAAAIMVGFGAWFLSVGLSAIL